MATETKQAPVTPTTGTTPAPHTVTVAKTPREAFEQERALHPVPYVAANLPGDFDTPFTTLPVVSETKLTPEQETMKKEQEAAKKEKAEVLKKIGDILAKFNHSESQIPANSEYWALLNQYRAM